MLNLAQIQNDLLSLLLSYAPLNPVNVMSERKLILSSEINYAKIYQTPRNGRAGAGIMVAMPHADSNKQNVQGPVLDWVFPVDCVEVPTINLNPSIGTLIDCETIGQMIMDAVHLYADDQLGTF